MVKRTLTPLASVPSDSIAGPQTENFSNNK